MSDREDVPHDLFDVIGRIDDLAEWLADDYPTEAHALRSVSTDLKDCLVISLAPDQDAS